MDEKEKKLRKNIGKKIKLARLKTDYTQEKLAEKLSLSSKYISQLERGVSFGSATTIVNICKALNINSDFLFKDLIDVSSSTDINLINSNFIKSYLQLNDYNKSVINSMAIQLLKIQEKNTKVK